MHRAIHIDANNCCVVRELFFCHIINSRFNEFCHLFSESFKSKKNTNSSSENNNIIYDLENSEFIKEENVRNDNDNSLNDKDIDAVENEIDDKNNNMKNEKKNKQNFFFSL